jgi:hypothetical protein
MLVATDEVAAVRRAGRHDLLAGGYAGNIASVTTKCGAMMVARRVLPNSN